MGPDGDVHVTVQDVKEQQELVDRFSVVRLIEEAVELARRGPESTDDLAPGHSTRADSRPGLHGEPIEKQPPEISRIVLRFQRLLDVDRPAPPRSEDVRERFPAELGIDEDIAHGVIRVRLGIRARVRERQRPARRPHQERLPAVVVRHGTDLHSLPSASSALMISRSRLDANPSIGR
jgi:hypothetical protein